jgi:hypothetical protein
MPPPWPPYRDTSRAIYDPVVNLLSSYYLLTQSTVGGSPVTVFELFSAPARAAAHLGVSRPLCLPVG